MNITIKRVYEAPEKSDGIRILIDRLWPRGVSKEKAKLELWLKDIAPSTKLRKWFGHDPDKWQEFQKKYAEELNQNSEQVEKLQDMLKKGKVTLVFGAKDEQHNDAVVVKEYLEKR